MKRITFKKIEPATDQTVFINKIFLDEFFEERKEIVKKIKKKISGYKQQDIKKNRLDVEYLVKYDAVIEKLLVSKLTCNYCKNHTLIKYNDYRDPRQWTLD